MDIAAFEAHAKDASQFLKLLANQHRLMVLCLLIGGELSVGDLHARTNLSQSALSQHLASLREAGLVATRREAQTIFYALANENVMKVIELLKSIYCPDQ